MSSNHPSHIPPPDYGAPLSGRWLREQIAHAEDAGYFGPGSASWRIGREGVLALGLGRALLMQIAHPWVAQAVHDHSTFGEVPMERLMATATAAEFLVFGSRGQADRAAERIRTVHTFIHGELQQEVGRWKKGTPYRAGEPEALLWVLATLVDTALLLYERCFGPIAEAIERAYLADAATLGGLIGIPREMVWTDRPSLDAYMQQVMTDGTVAVGEIALGIAEALDRPALDLKRRLLMGPFHDISAAIAVETMPEPLKRQYGSRLRVRNRWFWHFAGIPARQVLRRLPARAPEDSEGRAA
jgi:uncharacterized protein (DUF2236 family)